MVLEGAHLGPHGNAEVISLPPSHEHGLVLNMALISGKPLVYCLDDPCTSDFDLGCTLMMSTHLTSSGTSALSEKH